MGKSNLKFLYLSENDVIKAGVFNHANNVRVIEEVLRLVGRGDYIMGGKNHNEHGIKIYPPTSSPYKNMPLEGPDRRFASLPAYIGGEFNVCGEKWYGSNLENSSKGLPRSILMINLTDPITGAPIAYMSGNLISAVRTGTVASIGAKYLASDSAKTCGFIGCGAVNRIACASLLNENKKITKVYLNDINSKVLKEFKAWIENKYDIDVCISLSSEDCVRNSDILCVAASQQKPVKLKSEWVKEGCLTIVFGGIKFNKEHWIKSKNVFDNIKMHRALIDESKAAGTEKKDFDYLFAGQIYELMEQGLHVPIEDSCNFPDVICGNVIGRENQNQKINLMTFGMGVYDVAMAYSVYKAAVTKKIGTELTVWDEPFDFNKLV